MCGKLNNHVAHQRAPWQAQESAQARIKWMANIMWETSKCTKILDDELEKKSYVELFVTPPQSPREAWSRYDKLKTKYNEEHLRMWSKHILFFGWMQDWMFHYWQALYSIKIQKKHWLNDELTICSYFIGQTYVMEW